MTEALSGLVLSALVRDTEVGLVTASVRRDESFSFLSNDP